MANTLVLKSVDFSVNKIETVTFGETIPCTDISLDKSTESITSIGGTKTIVATPTPANTTDSVIWSSSNNNVVTVAGGVVTAVGCGTATITATCGEQSDTCTFTVTHVADVTFMINKYYAKGDNKDFLNSGELANRACGFYANGSNKKIAYEDRGESRYPYPIPNGATTIVISCTNFKPYGYWLNSLERASISGSVALALTADAFGTAQASAGSRTVTIPEKTGDYANMDSVAFSFVFTGSTLDDSSTDEITITFTA